MGLESSRPTDLQEKIERYRKLTFLKLDKKLERKDAQELRKLRIELQNLPPTDSVALAEEMSALLDRLRRQKLKK